MINLNESFESEGYMKLERFFSELELMGFDAALENVLISGDVNIYYDRSGSIRRLEKFVFKDKFFKNLNNKIESLLFEITKKQYCLFKDKINFKPPGGEGFYAHYDGIFKFDDGKSLRRGWYEYADEFVNVLIALNDFTIENGALEIAKIHEGSFDDLFQNTKQDGSPNLTDAAISKCFFTPITIGMGGVVIFSNLCPHRSSLNKSSASRGSIYFTYNQNKFGNNYERYFMDKKNSSNSFKALTGEI